MTKTDEMLQNFEARRRLEADLRAGAEIAYRQKAWSDEQAIYALKSLDLFHRKGTERSLIA